MILPAVGPEVDTRLASADIKRQLAGKLNTLIFIKALFVVSQQCQRCLLPWR